MTARDARWRNRIIGSADVAPDQLLAHPSNWRLHPGNQQNALTDLLGDEHGVGWVARVMVNKRTSELWPEGDRNVETVVDGHLRVALAMRHNQPTVPVDYVDLTPAEEALVLATFDPIGAMATASAEQLDAVLREVQTGSEAVGQMLADLAGHAGLYLPEMGPTEAEPPLVTDRLDALVEKYGVKSGQLWIVEGKAAHRVFCGDSTDLEVVRRALGGNVVSGLIYDPDWDNVPDVAVSQYGSVVAFTDGNRARDVITKFGAPTWVFVWDGVTSWYTPNRPLKRAKLAFWYGNVEAFSFDGAHYGQPDKAHEVSNTRGTYQYTPDPRGKHLSDVFQLSLTELHSGGLHPYEKPADWVRLLIGDCLPVGAVFDPFLGSGATLVACEQLGRSCYGVDVAPEYIALSLDRAVALGCSVRVADDTDL